jgi:hypothetical protein
MHNAVSLFCLLVVVASPQARAEVYQEATEAIIRLKELARASNLADPNFYGVRGREYAAAQLGNYSVVEQGEPRGYQWGPVFGIGVPLTLIPGLPIHASRLGGFASLTSIRRAILGKSAASILRCHPRRIWNLL